MAKKQTQQQQKRRKTEQKETNWLLIGALVTIGVIVFGGLLALALRPATPEVKLSLEQYCAENEGQCFTKGSDDAPVKIVNVSDYGCINCYNFKNQTEPLIDEQYVASGQVQWIFLPYALNVSTVQAASAGMCAGAQGLYNEFTEAMYAIDDAELRLSEEGQNQSAQAAGVDMAAFETCMQGSEYVDSVYRNKAAAEEAGVSGTPTFFVNGKDLVGNQPFNVFQQQIASALASQ